MTIHALVEANREAVEKAAEASRQACEETYRTFQHKDGPHVVHVNTATAAITAFLEALVETDKAFVTSYVAAPGLHEPCITIPLPRKGN